MTQNAFAAWVIRPGGVPPSSIDLQSVAEPDPACLGILVLYDDPRHALARSIVAGRPASKALSDWDETARLVLALHRQNRDRMRLVQRPLTSLDETSRKQKLLELFEGNALPSLSPEPAAQDESTLAWASLALLASDDRRLLHDELIASTTGDADGTLDGDAALAMLSVQLDAERQRDLLMAQIDDLERHLRKVIDVRQRLWQDIKVLKSRLNAVHASTSWRVTGPMRRFARLLKGHRGKPAGVGTQSVHN